MRRQLFSSVFLPFLFFCSSSAQESQGTILLTVSDRSSDLERVLHVQLVELTSRSVVLKQSARPNEETAIRGVPFGAYTLQVFSDSLLVAEREVNFRSSVPMKLELAAQREYRVGEVVVTNSRGGRPETSTHTVHTAATIDQLPSASSSKKIEAILLNTPGVVPDEDGRLHIRGEHAQIQYIIDGIPVTSDMSRVYSSLLNAQLIKSVDIQTGALNPEFGVAAAGVVSITSKSGFDSPLFARAGVQFGSFGGKEGTAEVGGALWKQVGFYAMAGQSESDRYLDPVSGFDPIHSHGTNRSFFGKVNAIAGANADVNILGSVNNTEYEVPNGSSTSHQDQRQKLNDYLVGARVNLQTGDQSLLSALFYTRFGKADITSGGLRQIASAANTLKAIQENEKFFIGGERSQSQDGVQLEYSSRFELSDILHEIKVGAEGEVHQLKEFFTFAVTNPALSDSSVPGGDIRYRAIDITQGGKPFLVDQTQNGYRSAAYIQDALSFGRWRIEGGVRYDVFSLYHVESFLSLFGTESFFSPRVHVAYRYDDDLAFRASYDRIVMQPPLENILVSSSAEARTLAGQPQGGTPNRVTSERAHVFELGGAYRVNEYLDVDLAGYTKLIEDFLVKVELGNSGVIFPVNLKNGFVGGGDLRVRLHEWNDLSGSFSLSASTSLGIKPEDGSSPIAAGLILGEEGRNYSTPFGGEDMFPTEHNQLLTAVMNLAYRVGNGVTVTLGGRFDSGLPFDLTDKNGKGLNEEDSRAELRRRGYSDDVIDLLSLEEEEPGSPDKSVSPHAVFDVGVNVDLRDAISLPLRLSASVLNVFDAKYLYKFESSFGGTHFGMPRMVQVRVEGRL